MNKTVIYYFSGTGNSLFAARDLQKQLDGAELRPIVSSSKDIPIVSDADIVGFVFPIYMMGMPLPVYDFIKAINLESSSYIFAVATRLGITHAAFRTIDKLLKKKNKTLDAHFSLTMADNSAKFDYVLPTADEISDMETIVKANISSIANIVSNKKTSRENDTTANKKVAKFLVNMTANIANNFNTKLHADQKCVSCGTCAKVCLSEKVKMVDGAPIWDENVMCYKCNACVTFCPEQSAQITKYTEDNERYTHPYATADDIAAQK